jgi:predicted enzyme related to lactoylglutathione lyase/SAM-dependent methyltransferase
MPSTSNQTRPLCSPIAWHELVTDDPRTATRFYGELLGWRVGEPSALGESPIRLGEKEIGCLRPPRGLGRTGWVGHVAVADLRTAQDQIPALGGVVLERSTEHRLIASDAAGGTFGCISAVALAAGGGALGSAGEFCWHELLAREPSAAVQFYRSLWGWSDSNPGDGHGAVYALLADKLGVVFASLKRTPPNAPSADNVWIPYVSVPDIDASVAHALHLSARLLCPPETLGATGTCAVIIDPMGGILALLEPARPGTRQRQLSPDIIMRYASTSWACAALGTAVQLALFAHVEAGADTAATVAERAGISARGAQVLLRALVGLGLMRNVNGRYRNSPEAACYLIEGQPTYLGALAKVEFYRLPAWSRLPDSVRSGCPATPADLPEDPFWEEHVLALAPKNVPVAQRAGAVVGIDKAGPVSLIDIGGGSGVFSSVWLRMNSRARATQLDWANVNRVARRYVTAAHVGDRFETIDGDLHTTDIGTARYDYAIVSHVTHFESPERNLDLFRRIRAALKPGGALIVSDFMLGDDDSGHVVAQLFGLNMLLVSPAGNVWRRSEISGWMLAAGFTKIDVELTPTPSTLLIAR